MTNLKTWMKRTVALSAVGMAAFAVGAPKAEAGTSLGTFVVSTTVNAACTLTTANLVFPNYTTGSVTAVNGTAAFSVNCPGAAGGPLPVNLTFTPVGNGGAYGMQVGGAGFPLVYKLCNDGPCTQVYGVGLAGPNTTINTTPQTLNVFGQINAPQAAPAAAGYQQTVNATLTY